VSEHPSRFTLTLRAAGDLKPEEAAGVDAHVAICPACRAAASEIERDREDYGGRAEAERARFMIALADTPRELRDTRGLRRAVKVGFAVAGLAAAAVIAIVVATPFDRSEQDGPSAAAPPDIAFKGALAVQIVAKRGGRQFFVRPGDALEADDALRFVVTAPEAGYVAVLSVEEAGRVSVFYPPESAAAPAPWPVRIESRGRRELPGSIILDEAPGSETYVVLFSSAPFSREAAERIAAALSTGRREPPRGFEGRALRVRKVAHRGP
jgi:hypothetical protein